MKKIIVTSYINPDLDGIAASYAYAEYFEKTGQLASYCFEGQPKKEVSIVCNLFDISLTSCNIGKEDYITIVDTNTIKDFPSFVDINNVVEIIDHHVPSQDTPKFLNAKVQIELIAAVATLIAERFYENNIPISRNSAILLYYAIISNSINLHSQNTSSKDIEMLKWLSSQCSEINERYIKKIFEEKSEIDESHLREEREADYILEIGNKKLIIAQLEIVDAMNFLSTSKIAIENILNSILEEKQLDYIFLNCIDILNGYSILYTPFLATENYIKNYFEGEFDNGQLILTPLYMRKEIIKLLKEKNSLNF